MIPDRLSPCPQCGAVPREGKTCQDKYGEILALEFEDPTVFGSVHHITVLCHNLQHPDFFSEEALEWMRSSLRAALEEDLSAARLLKQARKGAADGRKVRRHTLLDSTPQRIKWSMTVMDVRTDSAEVYTEDIRAWAKSILKDLGRQ